MPRSAIPNTTTTTSTTTQAVTTTTTAPGCVNPILKIIPSYVLNAVNPSVQLIGLLNKGIVNGDCNTCCPDCDQFYILGNAQKFNFFTNNLTNNVNGGSLLPCCLNYTAEDPSIIVIPDFTIPIGTIASTCPTNFNSSVDAFKNIIGVPAYDAYIAPNGIVEYSSIKNTSGLQVLIQAIQASPNYSPTLLYNLLQAILTVGLVIYCDQNNGKTVIGSAESVYGYLATMYGVTASA